MLSLEGTITKLHGIRERIAALGRELAERELEGRVMRLSIELEKRQTGSTQTAAEKEAKADKRYLDHELKSIRLKFDHDVLTADAEADAYDVELQLALLRRIPEGAAV